MAETDKNGITVKVTINAPVEKVWEVFTTPQHITQWNNASPEWYTPTAENDLKTGGAFLYRMEAKDGSFGFDFSGLYSNVKTNELIAYTMGDGREVTITFTANDTTTEVEETFVPENQNPVEMQKAG